MMSTSRMRYPIDISTLLAFPRGTLDGSGVFPNAPPGAMPAPDNPTSVAQLALIYWNAYLANEGHEHKEAFMTKASWLLAHESRLSSDAGGWPIPFPLHAYYASRPWLSAVTQSNVLSVMVRAYQLSGEEAFLQAAQRAVHTFELDILDGGVSTLIGDNGVFFEEVAVYPAAHTLKGFFLALIGLYDYVFLTMESRIEALIQRSLATLHTVLEAFDTGYWTHCDLLHKHLAPWFSHSLHISLLEAVARYSGCGHCAALAAQWAGYQHRHGCRLRYLIARGATTFYDEKLKPWLHRFAFRTADINCHTSFNHVCIPIATFGVPGGMRSVLVDVAHVMDEHWQITYLTHRKGQATEGLEIEAFGRKIASPWHFPTVWLYCLAGWGKLFTLLRHDAGYQLILPQDGVFTGAFAALVGKMAGVRVVCMDHGNMTWLDNSALRTEKMNILKAYPWYRRILARLLFPCYWSSLRLLARIATRCTDQFLIAGDEVEDVYRKSLGVHSNRIIRYAYMVDVAHFTPPDGESRARMRAERGLSEEAIIITLINRLAPEKGLGFALRGIALALAALPADIRTRVRVLIAGEGPLRSQIEADIQRLGLDAVCILWGEATPSDVVMLLGIADIFLYSGTRGTNYSMAVLEAMAAARAVIASISPRSNAQLLAEGRGIAIEPCDANAISRALVRLCVDAELCRQMGRMAREYVATYHTPLMLKRSLLRGSFFAPVIRNFEPYAREDEHFFPGPEAPLDTT